MTKIQPRTIKEFLEIQYPSVVLGWVAQYPFSGIGQNSNVQMTKTIRFEHLVI